MNLLQRYVKNVIRSLCRRALVKFPEPQGMRCYVCHACQFLAFCSIVSAFFIFQGMIVIQETRYNSSSSNVAGSLGDAKDHSNLASSGGLATQYHCQGIHIVIPCTTLASARNLTTLVKSALLYSRDCVFTLHLVTTTATSKVLQLLFTTWALPQVHLQYYSVESKGKEESLLDAVGVVLRKVNELKHHSKFLVVDPSAFFVSDVSETWNRIPKLLEDKMMVFAVDSTLSLPEASAGSQLKGLLLVDITNMVSWMREQKGCTEGMFMVMDDPLSSNDQDALISSICANSTEGMYDGTGRTVVNVTRVALLELPDVFGQQTSEFNPHSEHYQQLLDLDGDIFRTVPTACAKPLPEPNIKTLKLTGNCYEYRYSANILRRTHLFFYNISNPVPLTSGPKKQPAGELPDPATDTTLVTQLLLNRIQGLERLLKVWHGPASVSLYLTDEEAGKFAQYIKDSPIMRSASNVQFHIVYRRHKYYPINHLRNLAVNQVQTPYYVMLDVDFVPTESLYEQIRSVLGKLSLSKKRALVVPTFETSDEHYVPPKTKAEFIKDLDSKKVEPYHQRKGMWRQGHSYTNYDKWKSATIPYRVHGKFGYEPYIVVPSSAPQYHDILLERMRDKLTYTVEIEKAGFELFVLPNAFVVHLPHPKSDSCKYGATKKFQRCAREMYDEILMMLRKKYGR